MILDAMKYVRVASKKGMDIKIILRRISKTSATNLDEGLLKIEINEIINKGIIDKPYKILNEHGQQQRNKYKKKILLPQEVNNDSATQHSKRQARPIFILTKHQPSEAYNFTKSSTSPWVFFTFFKLRRQYQIAQSITYLLSRNTLKASRVRYLDYQFDFYLTRSLFR